MKNRLNMVCTYVLTGQELYRWSTDWTWAVQMRYRPLQPTWHRIGGNLCGHGKEILWFVLIGPGQERWCADCAWAVDVVFWLDKTRKDGKLSGHGQISGIVTRQGQDRWSNDWTWAVAVEWTRGVLLWLNMGRVDGVLNAHRQETWYTYLCRIDDILTRTMQ